MLTTLLLFFFNNSSTTDIYTLSLHDALPISERTVAAFAVPRRAADPEPAPSSDLRVTPRSEEHTSELQSPCNLVCRLLLEKKKTVEPLRNQLLMMLRLLSSNVSYCFDFIKD